MSFTIALQGFEETTRGSPLLLPVYPQDHITSQCILWEHMRFLIAIIWAEVVSAYDAKITGVFISFVRWAERVQN